MLGEARPSLARNHLYNKRYHVQCAIVEVNKMRKQIIEISQKKLEMCPGDRDENAYSHKAKWHICMNILQ